MQEWLDSVFFILFVILNFILGHGLCDFGDICESLTIIFYLFFPFLAMLFL
jgi:hypothetical protein